MYENDRGWSKVKLRKRWQSQNWRQKKWCSVCDEIGKESFTTICCRRIKWLILTSTANMERLRQAIERKWQELINRKGVVFHHDNARPHTSLATRQKLRELSWEVLTYLIYLIVLTLHHQTTIWFDLYKTLLGCAQKHHTMLECHSIFIVHWT